MDDIPLHNPDEWEFGDCLGKGALSEGVYRAKKLNGKMNNFILPNGGECVIKKIKVENDSKLYKKECSIIDRIIENYNKLKGVIRYYGYAKYIDENNSEYIYIYMEYLKTYESIGKLLKNYKFKDNHAYHIGKQLIENIKILHSNNIVHRDIKCDNILLDIYNGKIILIDFGISKYCESINKPGNHTFAGTITHMAPEINSSNVIINKLDIWSIGCTLLELLGANLNTELSKDRIIDNMSIGNLDLKIFIKHCLVMVPTSRNYYKFTFSTFWDYPKFLLSSGSQMVETAHYNQPLTPDSIPSFVKKLDLPSFNQPIAPNSIPESVTILNLPLFNQPITPNSIPESVTILNLPSFNKPIAPNSIPSSVKSLSLPSFNQPITPNSIPSLVNKLDLPSFNQPITLNSTPSSLTSLSLPLFNQPITPNSIPSSVKSISLPSFNQPITPNSIPSSVTRLYLPSFNQPITPNSIPESVTRLSLTSFNQPITSNSIPSSVTELDLTSFNQPIAPNSIPSSVTELFLLYFNQPITPNSILSSVRSLNLPLFNQPITPNSIPESVTILNLPSFNQPITPNSIPSSVTELFLLSFNQNVEEDSIPSSILKLKFDNFNLNENGDYIPDNILEFECNFNFQSALKKNNNIPKKTSNLILRNYNFPITKGSIPNSVISLELGSNFKDFESFINLPSSIITLKFGVGNCEKDEELVKSFIPKYIANINICGNLKKTIKIK